VGKLVLLLADGTTLGVPLNKERMTIGRRADNDICLPHPAVSGEHSCVVTILADSFLEDLGSTNGTLVNGKPIVKHFLRDYDQIDIGRQRLVFVSDDNARVEGLPPDIARHQLMGLSNRVEGVHAAPAVPTPVIGGRRVAAKELPFLDRDLEDAPMAESPPVAAAVRNDESAASIGERRPPPSRRESDQRLAAWAAEWAAPSGHAEAGPIDTAAEPVGALQLKAGLSAQSAAESPALEPARPEPSVRVLSGPNLGRAVPFTRDELSVGRVGMQVAVVRKVGSGFRLVPVEGAQPPKINGAPVAPEGAALHPGDTFEVAGVRLELSVPV
jgi:hypothetical protein